MFQDSLALHGYVLVTSMRLEIKIHIAAFSMSVQTLSACSSLDPYALRPATLEATRPRGSQQQADMGQ